ncbi:MAG: hypothetical protein M1834_005583 [Cirrosporium novae-zelandiae]|nr:MAG: hypothetical protein M1834_005583 [Cirrosporium novae-zelandiae]
MSYTLILFILARLFCLTDAQYFISVNNTSPFSLSVHSGVDVIVQNSAILTGSTNSSTQAISASTSGTIVNQGGQISWILIDPSIVKVSINSSNPFVGAQFDIDPIDFFYGVWEYPWFDSIENTNVSFELKGVGNSEGINWSNARAPFFLTNAGYGVYADTLDMGSYDFTVPGQAQFIFNTSSLVYYIILPKTKNDFKSIITQYTGLSARLTMPPDTGYGPTFWSGNFEEDYHDGVSNAQENYYDVVNHLYYKHIHATSMVVDRPFGTGNSGFGNFDFDPKFYPTPKQFISNMSDYGFTLQAWVANRAFPNTELYNVSSANGWLFPSVNPKTFLGPALNLSIPAAYNYMKKKLSFFPSMGIKGYKIDRGEEGEMPVYEQNTQMTLFESLCADTMTSVWGKSGYQTLSRSVYDRSRAQTNLWNGDGHSNFTGLTYTIASGIRASLLGFSQWGSDTGGYVRTLETPTEELWARWMHFSTFTPIYELMLGQNHTPWYPPYTSNLVSVLKSTANTHHSLIPFLKSHTHVAATSGLPAMRALLLEYPDDPLTYTLSSQYALGSEFLLAPISTPGGVRSVYFPKGYSFLEYFNKTDVYIGGRTVIFRYGLDSSPVFVREGAIIPRGDVVRGNNLWTDAWTPQLRVEVYPSFAVPRTEFLYFGGEKKDQEARIIMTTTKAVNGTGATTTGSVSISYEDLGIPGTIVVYLKGWSKGFELQEGGGEVSLSEVQVLF